MIDKCLSIHDTSNQVQILRIYKLEFLTLHFLLIINYYSQISFDIQSLLSI